MWPTWMNMLGWWQWAILLAVPPAIISLYFLKLRRRPVEVPSTYLWSRSIEDLHVNSIWQRLRRNLLLLLQLLLLLLLIVALLRPAWRGEQLIGHRLVFLIDNSASMKATDERPNRLERAKRRALALVDEMRSGDVGMVISFADTARIEQMRTGDRAALGRAIRAIKPTDRSTSLVEALQVAAAQADPRQIAQAAEEENTTAVDSLPATAYILSDGGFGPVSESTLGNLRPVYIPIGRSSPANVAILTFAVRRHESQEDYLRALARLKNFSPKKVDVEVTLRLDGKLKDADRVAIEPGQTRRIAFDLGEVDSGVLRLSVAARDCFAVDDEAWVAVNPVRPAEVLLVTPGNQPLELALTTRSAAKLAHVVVEPTSFLKTQQYATAAAGGADDLIIYDRCRPTTMPQANTLFIGNVPPGEGWSRGEPVAAPRIIDTDPTHPMMQWLAMDDVVLREGRPIGVPPGGDILIDSDAGPMLVIAPRETFQDAATGFLLVEEEEGGQVGRTTWPIRPSFPMFVLNTLGYLGGGVQEPGHRSARPGHPITLEAATGGSISVVHPDGQATRLEAVRAGRRRFSATEQLGVYEVRSGGRTVSRFAVNLFDPRESDLAPRGALDMGAEKIAGRSGWEAARREIWRPLLLLGLFVLIVEWYIYNQRVSM